jgi:Domain of unknown function (DUF4838)/Glycosyl hydrolase family 67 N-terminus
MNGGVEPGWVGRSHLGWVGNSGGLIAALLLLPGWPTLASAQDLTIIRDGVPLGAIVVSTEASPSEKHGATELQVYLKQMSGSELPLIDEGQPLPAHCVIVGRGRQSEAAGVKIGADALGPEEFEFHTVGGRLIIVGGRQRGTMYGCFALLEKLGVRWLTPEVTVVPKRSTVTLPALGQREYPGFEYREAFFTEALDRDWAAHLRLNGNGEHLDKAMGGKITYQPFVHTFDELIPRSLFAAHPEYFPLINGKRTDGYVQRCLSNPDVVKLAIATVGQWIRDHPEATIYSVSQNDTANWCECEQCQAIAHRYGTQSGLYIWFVNQTAEAIEKEHPDKLIDTLAYQFTEAAPTGIAPRKNVRVRLCPINVCEAHPYDQCREQPTVEFMKNLRAWGSLTSTLYIWHYDTDFANYLAPFPDFNELPSDIRLFYNSRVKGLFFEGAYGKGGGGSDAELRSYVIAKLLWDPMLDANAIIDEWMSGVYGPAAGKMRQWFDLLHANVRDPNRHFHIYEPVSVYYLDADTLKAGDKLFDEAAWLAASNPTASRYVAKSRLWLRYVEVARSPAPHAGLGQFLEDVRGFGIQEISEGKTVDRWAREMGGK